MFVNLYGPIEIHVDCTYFIVDREFADDEPLPIGVPCRNTEILILDEHDAPCADGQMGELCVRGSSLALGYWNDPEKTAKAFVQNPLNRRYPEWIYRTGDLAQWRGDGQIEYCGRADHQVKVRGFRIELDEVAAALREQPHVTEAVVILRDSQLHAYVSLSAPINDLRARLAKQLPAYMVPASITILPALPIGPTGKVDREALPAPVIRQSDAAAPTTELQRQLAAIWAAVLALPVVGIEDDFFALGGHSLLAVQLVERIRTTLDEPITVRALFEHPTVTALAAHLEAIHWARRAQQRSDQALPTGEL
jgi:acyl-coenzyme A synthetase/AMP-(fatty) acid ligase